MQGLAPPPDNSYVLPEGQVLMDIDAGRGVDGDAPVVPDHSVVCPQGKPGMRDQPLCNADSLGHVHLGNEGDSCHLLVVSASILSHYPRLSARPFAKKYRKKNHTDNICHSLWGIIGCILKKHSRRTTWARERLWRWRHL